MGTSLTLISCKLVLSSESSPDHLCCPQYKVHFLPVELFTTGLCPLLKEHCSPGPRMSTLLPCDHSLCLHWLLLVFIFKSWCFLRFQTQSFSHLLHTLLGVSAFQPHTPTVPSRDPISILPNFAFYSHVSIACSKAPFGCPLAFQLSASRTSSPLLSPPF